VLIAAFIILSFAVLLGSTFAVLHLRAQTGAAASWPVVPWPVAALHAFLGIGGLVCLVLALRGPPMGPERGLAQGTASFGMIAATLFALAALAGGGILATHLRKRRRAGTLIGLHAALAVSGFVILAAYLLAG
jgi:hypothetical protein